MGINSEFSHIFREMYYIQSAIHRNLAFLKNKSEHFLYESTSMSFVYSPLGRIGDLAAGCIYPCMAHLL